MALTINDRVMTSDCTRHAARLTPGEVHHWEVSWLPGRNMTRNEAITAMTLAEAWSPAETRDWSWLWPRIQGWAAELGLTAAQAVTQVGAKPAWAVTTETAPGQADPEAGE